MLIKDGIASNASNNKKALKFNFKFQGFSDPKEIWTPVTAVKYKDLAAFAYSFAYSDIIFMNKYFMNNF